MEFMNLSPDLDRFQFEIFKLKNILISLDTTLPGVNFLVFLKYTFIILTNIILNKQMFYQKFSILYMKINFEIKTITNFLKKYKEFRFFFTT